MLIIFIDMPDEDSVRWSEVPSDICMAGIQEASHATTGRTNQSFGHGDY